MPCRGLVTKQTYAVRSWTFINAEVALLFNYAVFKGVTFILTGDFSLKKSVQVTVCNFLCVRGAQL